MAVITQDKIQQDAVNLDKLNKTIDNRETIVDKFNKVDFTKNKETFKPIRDSIKKAAIRTTNKFNMFNREEIKASETPLKDLGKQLKDEIDNGNADLNDAINVVQDFTNRWSQIVGEQHIIENNLSIQGFRSIFKEMDNSVNGVVQVIQKIPKAAGYLFSNKGYPTDVSADIWNPFYEQKFYMYTNGRDSNMDLGPYSDEYCQGWKMKTHAGSYNYAEMAGWLINGNTSLLINCILDVQKEIQMNVETALINFVFVKLFPKITYTQTLPNTCNTDFLCLIWIKNFLEERYARPVNSLEDRIGKNEIATQNNVVLNRPRKFIFICNPGCASALKSSLLGVFNAQAFHGVSPYEVVGLPHCNLLFANSSSDADTLNQPYGDIGDTTKEIAKNTIYAVEENTILTWWYFKQDFSAQAVESAVHLQRAFREWFAGILQQKIALKFVAPQDFTDVTTLKVATTA